MFVKFIKPNGCIVLANVQIRYVCGVPNGVCDLFLCLIRKSGNLSLNPQNLTNVAEFRKSNRNYQIFFSFFMKMGSKRGQFYLFLSLDIKIKCILFI